MASCLAEQTALSDLLLDYTIGLLMLCFTLCLFVCVCIRNGDLKLSCDRNCDYLQVHREWGGDWNTNCPRAALYCEQGAYRKGLDDQGRGNRYSDNRQYVSQHGLSTDKKHNISLIAGQCSQNVTRPCGFSWSS